MSRYQWDAPITGSERAAGATIAAQAEDGATITLYLDSRDYELRSTLVVTDERGRAIASTDDAAQWPTVERYVPRSEWPAHMLGRANDATPDPAVIAAIADYAADYLADFVDDFGPGADESDRPDDYDEIVTYWAALMDRPDHPEHAAELTRLGQEYDEIRAKRRAATLAAVDAGMPKQRAASLARVTRPTVDRWINEAD